MKPIFAGALLAALLCSGCATTQHRPLVDSGVSRGSYEEDVDDCRQLAERRPVSDHAVAGATAGAVLGALLGLAVGLRGDDVAHLAAWGGVNGGIEGAAYGSDEQEDVIARCMAGRGYNVVSS
jgi:uncharacterized protein YcfJ